jgi:hypothetical protein
MKTRMQWVDVAKGASILLVALHHATLMFHKVGFDTGLLLALNDALKPERMPVFFTAAGLFAASSIAQPWPALVRRRIGYFMYLFLLWTAIRYAFFAVVPNPQTPTEGHDLSALALAILTPGTGLWFIWALAIFYFGVKVTERVPTGLMLGAAALISIASLTSLVPLAWPHINLPKYFVFFYAACKHREIIAALVSRRILAFALSAGAYAALFLAARIFDTPLADGLLGFASAVAGVLATCAFAALIADHAPGKLLAHLGRNTLGIYLVHVMLLAAMAQAARGAVDPDDTQLDLLLLGGSLVLAIGASRLFEEGAKRIGAHPILYDLPFRRKPAAAVAPALKEAA